MNLNSDILVIGETCTDIFYYGKCDRLCPEAPVPVFVLVHHNTNQMFVRVDENDDKVLRCNVKNIKLDKYKIIVISDYCKGFLLEEDIKYICENHDCVFLDTKKILGDWCVSAKFIKINYTEYNKTKNYLPDGIESKMIVTLGPKGCRYKDKIYPVSKVDIKDVSGAGDTFLSGLVVKYLETLDIEESILHANECATVAVQKKGVTVI